MFRKLNIFTTSYLFNYFIPTFLMIIFILFNYKNLGVEVGILNTFIIMISQIFSSNMRNIILSNEDQKLSEIVIRFRLFFSFLLFIFIYIFIEYFLKTESKLICITLSILFIQFWIYEIVIVSYEISKNFKKLIIFNLISFFYILAISILLSYQKTELISIFTIGYVLYMLFEIFEANKTANLKNKKIEFVELIKKNIVSSSFISSFSMVVSNFIWRTFIILFIGKSAASIYFLSFAIASLPGTIVNNFFGLSFLKQKIKINFLYKFVYFFIWLILIIITLNFEKITHFIFFDIEIIYLKVTLISLIGSFFMINAMYTRIKMISFLKVNNNHVFKIDVLYSILISTIIPALYLINEEYIAFAYLASSFFSFLLYNFSYKKM